MTDESDPDWDTDRARLRRIERKLNIFGELVGVALGLGAGYVAFELVTKTLRLPDFVGSIAALLACGYIGYRVWTDFRKG